jgi:hypothetical protein
MTAGDVIVVDGAVGPARQAAAFDGTDDYILADAHAVARVAANDTVGTYSAWVYLDAAGETNFQGILSAGDNDSDTEVLYIRCWKSAVSAVLNHGGATKWEVRTSTGILSAKTWTHIALVQNGTQPALYVNGVLQSVTNVTATDLTYWYDELTGCDKFAIGVIESNNTHTSDLAGMISDVKYWNKALTAAEVAKDYNGDALDDDGTYLQLHLLKGDNGITDQGLGADNGTLTGHAYLCGWGSEWSRRLETSGAVVADSIQTIPYERGRARTVIVKAA